MRSCDLGIVFPYGPLGTIQLYHNFLFVNLPFSTLPLFSPSKKTLPTSIRDTPLALWNIRIFPSETFHFQSTLEEVHSSGDRSRVFILFRYIPKLGSKVHGVLLFYFARS